jgi:hypothetical protein
MEIVTLAFNRPDFIELQYNSLKKWVKEPFNFIVFDNCPDDAVKNECERLDIHCIPIKIFSEDTSWAVGLSLNKMWEILKWKQGEFWYIDSDMFLINELPKMNCDMAFVPQVRGKYTYPWTGLMYFNMATLPHPEELKWQVEYKIKDTDVGGFNHFYLIAHNPKIQELEMWTIIDDNKFSRDGGEAFLGTSQTLEIELALLAYIHEFPHPFSFDVFKTSENKPFVFHYKSASNYPSFYTPEYNEKKTKALCKLLM